MEFVNVRLKAEANIYSGGRVSSRTFYTQNGERKTLGFMMPGEYSFDTGAAEVMEMLGCEMDVLLPGESEYRTFIEGSAFNVPANSSFKLIVREYADYCCSYLD